MIPAGTWITCPGCGTQIFKVPEPRTARELFWNADKLTDIGSVLDCDSCDTPFFSRIPLAIHTETGWQTP